MEESHEIRYITRTYKYDSLDRLISLSAGGSEPEQFEYDPSGSLISRSSPAAPIPSMTVVCTACGTSVGSTKQFCLNCGANIADQQKAKHAVSAPTTCPQCGIAVTPGKKFCNSCGGKIS
jgi:YD repeat-containing protein